MWKHRVRAWLVVSALACGACERTTETATAPEELAAAEIPFVVSGNADGLMLTYVDAEGPHVVQSRADVPEASRELVRVDSLELAPEERDPEHVFVVDLRTPGADGRYTVRRMTRGAFEERIAAARPTTPAAPPPSDEVIVFGASWCGACRQAEAYLRSRNIPFVEHDIEREPESRADMQRRARAAGITANGIPILDIRGRVLQGFDPAQIDRALSETAPAVASPTTI